MSEETEEKEYDPTTPIEVQLAVFNERLAQNHRTYKRILEGLDEMIHRHDRILMGNNGDPGLKSKIELLEEHKKQWDIGENNRRLNVRALWTAVLSVVAKTFYDLYKGK